MISAIVYDHIKEEARQIKDSIRDIIACRCNEESRIESFSTEEEVLRFINRTELVDFACVDICNTSGIGIAEEMRCRYPETRILLIADAAMPPDIYIRPQIMVSALILRPTLREAIHSTVKEFVGTFLDNFRGGMQSSFLVETKEGIIKIPFQQICYYESSMKKVFIRLKSAEYSFYGKLEQLMGQLPEYLIRCHRSFIINRNRVIRYDASDGFVILDDDIAVPVSRSYRSTIRDLLKQEMNGK